MIAFIDDHRTSYGVEPICRELPIAPSTYHAAIARRADPSKAPPRVRRDVAFRGESRRVEWVDWFNHRRLLEPIGNIPPAEAEAKHHAKLENNAVAA